MSSTKITKHDLDQSVFEGVAQESTVQEVLDTSQQVLATVILGSGGGVKKIQRGTATVAGTITIEEVVMEKTMVLSVSKGSAGYVAARGTLTTASYTVSGQTSNEIPYNSGSHSAEQDYERAISFTATVPQHTGTLSGGTTDLYVKEYSAVLTSPTTLECDGACEWQVIEFC